MRHVLFLHHTIIIIKKKKEKKRKNKINKIIIITISIYIYTTSSPSPKFTGTRPLPLTSFADKGLTWDQWTLLLSLFFTISEFLCGNAVSVSTAKEDFDSDAVVVEDVEV